jgi:hypothetical protein
MMQSPYPVPFKEVKMEYGSRSILEYDPRLRRIKTMDGWIDEDVAMAGKKRGIVIAEGEGVEPSFPGSKPSVLPLDDPSV